VAQRCGGRRRGVELTNDAATHGRALAPLGPARRLLLPPLWVATECRRGSSGLRRAARRKAKTANRRMGAEGRPDRAPSPPPPPASTGPTPHTLNCDLFIPRVQWGRFGKADVGLRPRAQAGPRAATNVSKAAQKKSRAPPPGFHSRVPPPPPLLSFRLRAPPPPSPSPPPPSTWWPASACFTAASPS